MEVGKHGEGGGEPDWLAHVLRFCSWRERKLIAGGVCMSWRRALWLNRDSWYWRHMCTLLGEEDIVHVSDDVVRAHGHDNYRKLFDEFWDMRCKWLCNDDEHVESMDTDATNADETDDFTIHVSCRLRPPRPSGDMATIAGASKVTVPLHQRIALVKAKNAKEGGVRMSTKQAMRIITNQERVAPPPTQNHASSSSLTTTEATAKTMIPPASEDDDDDVCGKDIDTNGSDAVSVRDGNDAQVSYAYGVHNESEVIASILDVDEQCGRLLTLCPSVGVRAFTFQSLMTAHTTNEECYTRSQAHRIVNDFLNGKSGAIVVYGQTGSGKTYTMFGSGFREHARDGIVQMACKEVVASVTQRRRNNSEITDGDISLQASFVEVYGNDVFDLLGGGERVGQNRVAGQRYVLDGHMSRSIHSAGDLDNAITSGLQYRSVGSHEMNAASSRSHTILILEYVERRRYEDIVDTSGEIYGKMRRSKLMFVDLGGSEKIHKSKVNDGISSAGSCTWSAYYEKRKRLYETININTGLFSLKRCIDALNERQEVFEEWAAAHHADGDNDVASDILGGEHLRRHLPHVPYADSRLTMILASILNANANSTANSGKIALIVTADSDDANAVETIQTLRFGEHVSRVKHASLRNGSGQDGSGGGAQSGLESVLAQMDGEIERLAGLIRDKERWVVKKETSVDPIDGTRLVKTVTVLEGAEDLHKDIDAIVKRRDQILLKCG